MAGADDTGLGSIRVSRLGRCVPRRRTWSCGKSANARHIRQDPRQLRSDWRPYSLPRALGVPTAGEADPPQAGNSRVFLASSRLKRSNQRMGYGVAVTGHSEVRASAPPLDESSFIVSAARTSTMAFMVPSDTSCGTQRRPPKTARSGLQDNQSKYSLNWESRCS
jgi:hypothetical protein